MNVRMIHGSGLLEKERGPLARREATVGGKNLSVSVSVSFIPT